jgi:hypothetical protein
MLENLRSAIGRQQDQCGHEQNQTHRTVQGGSQHLSSMPVMELGPSRKLGLVLGFQSLFAVPPGAPAVKIISNIRGADDRHISPFHVEKESIAQIF